MRFNNYNYSGSEKELAGYMGCHQWTSGSRMHSNPKNRSLCVNSSSCTVDTFLRVVCLNQTVGLPPTHLKFSFISPVSIGCFLRQ